MIVFEYEMKGLITDQIFYIQFKKFLWLGEIRVIPRSLYDTFIGFKYFHDLKMKAMDMTTCS